MEDKLISVETAKLAHSKGFDWIDKNNTSYHSVTNITGEIKKEGIKLLTSWIKSWKNDPTDTRYNYLALVPTQSLLQRWLRETYNIHIEVEPVWDFEESEYPEYVPWVIGLSTNDEPAVYYSTYEEALEAGLVEALNLIP